LVLYFILFYLIFCFVLQRGAKKKRRIGLFGEASEKFQCGRFLC